MLNVFKCGKLVYLLIIITNLIFKKMVNKTTKSTIVLIYGN